MLDHAQRVSFVRTTLRWYAYVCGFLLVTVLAKVVISNGRAIGDLSLWFTIIFQPLNVYVWGFATAMYVVFVWFMWRRLNRQ